MSDQLTYLQVVRDLGMVLIPGLTALGGVLLAYILEARRRRMEAEEKARQETWREYRTKIIEVKNYAASLYERRTSKQFDKLRKPFMRDLEALNDLAGYWHSYPTLYPPVGRYILVLRDLYEKTELDEVEMDIINYRHGDVDIACTKIVDKGQPPPNPWKTSKVKRGTKRRAEKKQRASLTGGGKGGMSVSERAETKR